MFRVWGFRAFRVQVLGVQRFGGWSFKPLKVDPTFPILSL